MTPQDPYREALLRARAQAAQLAGAADSRMRVLYERMLLDIQRDEDAGRITAKRAAGLRTSVIKQLSEFESVTVGLTDAAVRGALSSVARNHAAALESVRGHVATELDAVQRAAAVQSAARAGARYDYRAALRRNMRGAVESIDRLLESAVPRGVPVGVLTRDVAAMLAGDDAELLAKLRPSTGSARTPSLDLLQRYELTPDESRRARTLLYDSRRIVVSEVNNNHRESMARALAASPVVSAAKWQTSGNHPARDACDALAEVDAYGLGPGMHPPESWPTAPHPFCGCTAGSVLYRPARDWSLPKGPPPPLAVDLARVQLDGFDDPGEERRAREAFARSVGARDRP